MSEVLNKVILENPGKEEAVFSTLVNEWLESISNEVRDSTFMEYKRVANRFIIPELGNIRISQITVETTRRFIIHLESLENSYYHRPLSSNSIKHIYTILKQILKYGNQRKYFPVFGVIYKFSSNITQEGRCFPENDILKLTDFLTQTMTPRKYGVIVCIYTGIRIGELCALKWKDFDLSKGIMHIRKTVKRIEAPQSSDKKYQLVLGFPKTDTSYRDIPIPHHLLEQLTRLHATIISDDCFFLNGKSDIFVDPRSYQRSFERWLHQCELPPINFHSLRHSFASRCLQSGCDIKTLSELLGHSNPTITLKMYVHTTMEQKRKAVERLIPENL
ncbi:MAG: site-specific integrase [Hespellia sp.]|nr:site-specific integrase [Hespellia sp.]